MMLWSVPGAVARRLAHYARTAARPGGIRYLARRTREVAPGVIPVCAGTMVKITQQITQKARHQLRLEETASSLSMPREQLSNLVRRMSVAKPENILITYIGDIADHVAFPQGVTRFFNVADLSEQGFKRKFNIRVPPNDQMAEASTLIVYATAGFLSVWERLQEDLEQYFVAGWRQVIIVLITPNFQALEFASHSYMLSILLSNVPRKKFNSRLNVYLAREYPASRQRPLFQTARLVAEECWQRFRSCCLEIYGADATSPAKFSALAISVEPRPMDQPRQP